MKPVASYGIVNADTSGPGAFLRAAKWYWDELTDMFSAAGFSSVMIPMVPNTENVSRNGAPICTASIRTRFGSLAGYLEYLNDKDIENVECIGVSGQAMYNSLFETGLPIERFYEGFYEYAMDAAQALKDLKGSTLLVSPTPGKGFLLQEFAGDEEKIRNFEKESAQCLNKIAQDCEKLGVNVAFRNEFWTTMRGTGVDEYIKLLSDKVSFALDPAHLYMAEADYSEYFRKYAKQSKVVCFTDTKYVDTDKAYETISPEFPQSGASQRIYWDLGFGDIDFTSLFETLKTSGFEGPVILEPKYSLDIPKGILRMRTFWNRLEKEYAAKEAR
ncbi:MAG: sugar phosphate isomerase/epimerase [Parasporobacterium sp.]|nr:sugar phosphate isomerase/epimerase [Parasporobacterium sp.]